VVVCVVVVVTVVVVVVVVVVEVVLEVVPHTPDLLFSCCKYHRSSGFTPGLRISNRRLFALFFPAMR